MEAKTKNSETQDEEKACGICMTKHGHGAVRGELDCCDHLFCFVCILLWAKVESLCPTCKHRFTTVRRPAQYEHGVFPFERVVNIPRRDQVYHDASGNTTVAYVDPFAKARCSVCEGAEDDSLLVLCDLCDSTAHTYCVDLGATVPENDWFCQDCTVSRAEHENFHWSSEDNGQSVNMEFELVPESCVSTSSVDADANSMEDSDIITTAEGVVSISEIVHEPYDQSLSCCQVKFFQCTVPSERKPNHAVEVTMPSQRIPQTDAFQSRARTLRQDRSVNRSIQALRENWDALRDGSLSFSSLSVESSSKSCRTRNCSKQQRSISSTSSSQQPTAQVGYLGSARQDRHSYKIQKAWRMMDKAKSIQNAIRTSTGIHQLSKYPFGRGNASKEATDQSLNLHLTESKQFDTRELGNTMTKKQCRYQHHSHEKETEKHISQKWEKQKQGQVMTKEILELNNSLSTSSPAWEVQTSSHVDVYQENGLTTTLKNQCKNSFNVSNDQNTSTCMITLVESVPGASCLLKTKPELCASSSCKVNISEGKVHSRKASAESNMRKDHDAKREILSLVKRNLRLLSGNKQLGHNKFKEVARLATHTILASCGLRSRYVIRSLPISSCSHSEQNKQFQKSTLMPNSCRECFYVFVKDVVNLILTEKTNHAKS